MDVIDEARDYETTIDCPRIMVDCDLFVRNRAEPQRTDNFEQATFMGLVHSLVYELVPPPVKVKPVSNKAEKVDLDAKLAAIVDRKNDKERSKALVEENDVTLDHFRTV